MVSRATVSTQYSASSPSQSARDRTAEAGRRAIVNCFFVFFWLLILEGVLRKWLLPSLSSPLLFIRDPLVLFIYALALRHRRFPRSAGIVALACLAIASLFAGFLVMPGSPQVLLIGLRTSFGYFPLIFVAAAAFRAADVQRLTTQLLWVALPMTVLMVLQFQAPTSSWLNATAGGGEGQIRSVADTVRPPGTFSYFTGTGNFIALWAGVLLHGVYTGRLNKGFAFASSLCLFTCVAISGSRTVFAWVALVIVVLVFATLKADARRAGKVFVALMVIGIAGLVGTQFEVVNKGLSATQERASNATTAEGGVEGVLQSRVLYDFVRPFELINEAPDLGYGLGSGTNAAGLFIRGRGGSQFGRDGEREWARMVLETGPALGFGLIAYRLGLGVYLLIAALRALRRKQSLPLVLFGVYGYNLVNGNIGQPTMQGFVILAATLGLAVCLVGEDGTVKGGSVTQHG